jgi:hypothetical protein
MGEMLAVTERAKGTDKAGRKKIDGDRTLPSNPPPTLAELGVSKRESAEARLPERVLRVYGRGRASRGTQAWLIGQGQDAAVHHQTT